MIVFFLVTLFIGLWMLLTEPVGGHSCVNCYAEVDRPGLCEHCERWKKNQKES